jgi:hypothetical protein
VVILGYVAHRLMPAFEGAGGVFLEMVIATAMVERVRRALVLSCALSCEEEAKNQLLCHVPKPMLCATVHHMTLPGGCC